MHCVLTCDKKLEPAVGSMKILTALLWSSYWTSCVRGAPASCNIFAFIRRVAAVPACWLFKTSATSWPFDLESGVLVVCERCDMGYLCVNFSLPRPLCSRLRPDVHDICQTKASFNASALWGRRHHITWEPSTGAETESSDISHPHQFVGLGEYHFCRSLVGTEFLIRKPTERIIISCCT